MTFSIVGRCRRTGMFGVAVATSSIAVGARCPHARAGAGAVATQNVTDPALGPFLLDRMAEGLAAAPAMERALAGRRHVEYRQLLAIDRWGGAAIHTGSRILGTHGEARAEDCLAAGNLLKHEAVPQAMTEGFARAPEGHLAERLLAALEAALAAGGEQGPVHSAALLVVHEQPYPLVDLRCDWDEQDPVVRLRGLWSAYQPQMADYLTRAINPPGAPGYGVPGDR